MKFEDLQLAPALLKAVQDLGFDAPTPIQQEAIPVVLSGVDLMAGAQTGTGKTGGFALPILHRLAQEHPAKNKKGRIIPRALILAPTRELAAQIEESFRQFGKYLKLSTMVMFGGVSMNPQIQRLQRGVDIIIATPGRLLDLHQQGFVDLSQASTLVLDEADRMLDMGFIIDIRKILALLPKERQNLLFSATFSEEIRELAGQLLHEPHTIQVTPRNTTVERIEQIAHPVARSRKLELLIKLIQDNQWYQVLIFTRTKFGANKVSDALEKNGIKSVALHGNKSQAARTAALKGFKNGQIQAMVATDIAARGIDIDQLACVVNYELPNVSEDYVHRIGRTGRAGADGVAISLVTVDEAGFMQQIETLIKRPVEQIVIDGFQPDPLETAQPIVMGRQVLWGGIGRAPSRQSTASFVKAARQQINQPRSGAGTRAGRTGGGQARDSQRKDGKGSRGGRSTGASDGYNDRRPETRFAGPRQQSALTGGTAGEAGRGERRTGERAAGAGRNSRGSADGYYSGKPGGNRTGAATKRPGSKSGFSTTPNRSAPRRSSSESRSGSARSGRGRPSAAN